MPPAILVSIFSTKNKSCIHYPCLKFVIANFNLHNAIKYLNRHWFTFVNPEIISIDKKKFNSAIMLELLYKRSNNCLK